MVNPPADNAQTWRDLANQLTPEQIGNIEFAESRFQAAGIGDRPESRTSLLGFAQDYAEGNRVDAAHANVPVPAGAQVDSHGWEKNLDRDGWSRSLVWRTFDTTIEGADVTIDGRQQTDGTFTRQISLWASDGTDLTAASARALAAALAAAADELDRL